jgi:hypothetical protein
VEIDDHTGMRSWAFQASVLLLLAAIAIGVWLHASNGRYQFVKTEANEIVIDTRTGEYWVDANLHINPRTHQVETTAPPPPPAASASSSAPVSH